MRKYIVIIFLISIGVSCWAQEYSITKWKYFFGKEPKIIEDSLRLNGYMIDKKKDEATPDYFYSSWVHTSDSIECRVNLKTNKAMQTIEGVMYVFHNEAEYKGLLNSVTRSKFRKKKKTIEVADVSYIEFVKNGLHIIMGNRAKGSQEGKEIYTIQFCYCSLP